jgi:hypothetical protein
MSSPSIPFNEFPHPKAHGLLLRVAVLLVAIVAGFGAFWLCTFFGTSDLRSVTADRDADLILPTYSFSGSRPFMQLTLQSAIRCASEL